MGVKPVIDKTVPEEEEEITRETATEEVTPELTKPLPTSKRVPTLKEPQLKNRRFKLKRRSQNQNQLSMKLLESPSTISLLERPRPKRRKLELLKVLREPRLNNSALQIKHKRLSSRKPMLLMLRHPTLKSTKCLVSVLSRMKKMRSQPAEEEEVEEEIELRVEAEDKMPSKLLKSLTRISQLCEYEDLLDLPQKCCLIR